MKVSLVLTFNPLLAAIIPLGVAAFFARSVFAPALLERSVLAPALFARSILAPAHTPVTIIETGVGRLPCEYGGVCEPITLPHQLHLHPSHGI